MGEVKIKKPAVSRWKDHDILIDRHNPKGGRYYYIQDCYSQISVRPQLPDIFKVSISLFSHRFCLSSLYHSGRCIDAQASNNYLLQKVIIDKRSNKLYTTLVVKNEVCLLCFIQL